MRRSTAQPWAFGRADSTLVMFWAAALGCLYLLLSGCTPQPEESGDPSDDVAEPLTHSAPLHVLVIDDPQLAEAAKQVWSARSTAVMEIQQRTTDELLGDPDLSGVDLILYPAGLLGELVERDLIHEIPDRLLSDPRVARRDVLNFDRGPSVSWGRRVFAFSFGSPQFVLFYRDDLFAQLDITPPTTWQDYQEVAKRLADRDQLQKDGLEAQAPWTSMVEPLGPGWAGQVLLVRAAAYARQRNRFSTFFNYATMEPLIDQPPFVRALTELVEASRFGPKDARQLTPVDARRAVLEGHCAMALSWPTGDPEQMPTAAGSKAPHVSLAPVPSSAEVYGYMDERWQRRDSSSAQEVPVQSIAGRLGSVTRTSRQSSAALSMLATLAGKELSPLIATRSPDTTMFRQSHLEKPQQWVGDPLVEQAESYANLLRDRQTTELWMFSLRIPGRQRYLDALDEAVYSALDGAAPAEALQQAVQRWREITAEIDQQMGSQSQQRAYSRSLGLED